MGYLLNTLIRRDFLGEVEDDLPSLSELEKDVIIYTFDPQTT